MKRDYHSDGELEHLLGFKRSVLVRAAVTAGLPSEKTNLGYGRRPDARIEDWGKPVSEDEQWYFS